MLRALSVLAAAVLAAATGASAAEPIKLGLMYDATGPTAAPGKPMVLGIRDYVMAVNANGGVNGRQIEWVEHETGYKAAEAAVAYDQFKAAKVVAFLAWGTPSAVALVDKADADKLPMVTPGFGLSSSADGAKHPYSFPLAATLWSQATGAVQHIIDQSKGTDPKKLKVAYLYMDNPAGQEPRPVMAALQKKLGFELKEFAVPMPGTDFTAQVEDITRRFKADWVVMFTFGKGAAASMKELKRAAMPMDHVIGISMAGTNELDFEAADWATVEGLKTVHFVGSESDTKIHKMIKDAYAKAGKEVPADMTKAPTLYNWGVVIGAAFVTGLKNAKGLDGPALKAGLESITALDGADGWLPALKVSAADHEGGGFVRAYQVKSKKLVPVGEWMQAFHDDEWALVKNPPAK